MQPFSFKEKYQRLLCQSCWTHPYLLIACNDPFKKTFRKPCGNECVSNSVLTSLFIFFFQLSSSLWALALINDGSARNRKYNNINNKLSREAPNRCTTHPSPQTSQQAFQIGLGSLCYKRISFWNKQGDRNLTWVSAPPPSPKAYRIQSCCKCEVEEV